MSGDAPGEELGGQPPPQDVLHQVHGCGEGQGVAPADLGQLAGQPRVRHAARRQVAADLMVLETVQGHRMQKPPPCRVRPPPLLQGMPPGQHQPHPGIQLRQQVLLQVAVQRAQFFAAVQQDQRVASVQILRLLGPQGPQQAPGAGGKVPQLRPEHLVSQPVRQGAEGPQQRALRHPPGPCTFRIRTWGGSAVSQRRKKASSSSRPTKQSSSAACRIRPRGAAIRRAPLPPAAARASWSRVPDPPSVRAPGARCTPGRPGAPHPPSR